MCEKFGWGGAGCTTRTPWIPFPPPPLNTQRATFRLFVQRLLYGFFLTPQATPESTFRSAKCALPKMPTGTGKLGLPPPTKAGGGAIFLPEAQQFAGTRRRRPLARRPGPGPPPQPAVVQPAVPARQGQPGAGAAGGGPDRRAGRPRLPYGGHGWAKKRRHPKDLARHHEKRPCARWTSQATWVKMDLAKSTCVKLEMAAIVKTSSSVTGRMPGTDRRTLSHGVGTLR